MEVGYAAASMEYHQLLNDIRNMRALTPAQIEYISRLPKFLLLEVIQIYNQIVDNISYVLS
jgi:hypothetical protein